MKKKKNGTSMDTTRAFNKSIFDTLRYVQHIKTGTRTTTTMHAIIHYIP